MLPPNVTQMLSPKCCHQMLPPKCCHPNVATQMLPPKCCHPNVCHPNVATTVATQMFCPNVLPKCDLQNAVLRRESPRAHGSRRLGPADSPVSEVHSVGVSITSKFLWSNGRRSLRPRPLSSVNCSVLGRVRTLNTLQFLNQL